ncbi:hypothetical protein B0J11DRAFT_307019 [Dendryphion nanum]|uniref:Uncharacterized protein n=1 Tax=Dendryphion nanum TaxID=256645 RepID=A0A9P9IND9_9PLEO|nr:hypothetical protein B0J11DRAFT_307019 [Dendryphion nanum]
MGGGELSSHSPSTYSTKPVIQLICQVEPFHLGDFLIVLIVVFYSICLTAFIIEFTTHPSSSTMIMQLSQLPPMIKTEANAPPMLMAIDPHQGVQLPSFAQFLDAVDYTSQDSTSSITTGRSSSVSTSSPITSTPPSPKFVPIRDIARRQRNTPARRLKQIEGHFAHTPQSRYSGVRKPSPRRESQLLNPKTTTPHPSKKEPTLAERKIKNIRERDSRACIHEYLSNLYMTLLQLNPNIITTGHWTPLKSNNVIETVTGPDGIEGPLAYAPFRHNKVDFVPAAQTMLIQYRFIIHKMMKELEQLGGEPSLDAYRGLLGVAGTEQFEELSTEMFDLSRHGV